MASLPSSSPEPVRLGDAAWAVGLGLCALALFVATPIARVFGDGSMLISLFAAREFGEVVYIHALYLPLARGLHDVLFALGVSLDPAATLLALSQLSASFGIAASFLVARAFGIQRTAAALAAAFLAISPPIWFFADTTEVHAPHFAIVGFVALVTLFGPWRRPVLATLLMAACLPLVFLSHQSGLLLFPGWLFLAQVGRRRVAEPLSLRALFGGVAPAIAIALGLALVIAARMRDVTLAESFGSSSSQVTAHMQGHLLAGLWNGWLRPLALLWLPVLVGAWYAIRRPHSGLWSSTRTLALLTLILPSLAFFLVWGVSERGAYSLGTATFLGVLAAFGIQVVLARPMPIAKLRWATATTLGLLLLQATDARREVLAFDQSDIVNRTTQRAHAAEAAFLGHPEPHLLFSIDPNGQSVTPIAPTIHEASLLPFLKGALENGHSPAEFAQKALAVIEILETKTHSTMLLDRSYTTLVTEYPGSDAYISAIETALKDQYEITKLDGLGGGIWLLH